ncbi:MAG TPA: D-2-hydroxyacid dehydrogenase [Ktedonobacterales bacterium]
MSRATDDSEIGSPARSAPLIVTTFSFDDADLDRLRAAIGIDHLIVASSQDELVAALREHPRVEVVCSLRLPPDLAAIAPSVRWIQLPSAGADTAIRGGLVSRDSPIVVTTASGIHAVPIAEYALSSMLMFLRGWRDLESLRRDHDWPDHARWQALQSGELYGATLGIVGLGNIGRRVAQLGRAFGMHVLGLRRTALGGADPDVDALYPPDALTSLLATSDYVVITVPRTSATHHLIGEAELHGMRQHAYIVNVARGDVIDESALIRALSEGWIAGAGLDVTEHEPLDPASPLWTMPNVYISPHISGNTSRYGERLMDVFLDNLARYRSGQPLRNVVDPVRGY